MGRAHGNRYWKNMALVSWVKVLAPWDVHPPIWPISMLSPPKCSMYGIFTYIYPKNGTNVGKYTIHRAYGNDQNIPKQWLVGGWPTHLKNMRMSVGMIIPNWMENWNMFQTTKMSWSERTKQESETKSNIQIKCKEAEKRGANWCFLFGWTFEMFRILPQMAVGQWGGQLIHHYPLVI